MSSVRRFKTRSDEETRSVGGQLAGILPPSAVVALIGDLGTGKTTLTKGIAEGRNAAAADEVSSPTFTLIHEYGNPVSIYHVDLYRLDTIEQARRLGLEELFEQPALVLLEWGDRFPELLPSEHFEIQLSYQGQDHRFIELRQIIPKDE
jgi:tRNA threonylcarbamoyladenosine biosynthesis protein TsaE